MTGALKGFLMAAYAVIVGAVILWLIVSFWRSRRTFRGIPHKAIADPYAAQPVAPSKWVGRVGALAAVWALLHIAAVAAWAASGVGIARDPATYAAAAYFTFAAVLTGVGGLLLRACVARGRTLLAWGEFLFGVAVFPASMIALMMVDYPKADPALQTAAPYLTATFAAHAVIDVALGAAAHRVGLSAEALARRARAFAASMPPDETGESMPKEL